MKKNFHTICFDHISPPPIQFLSNPPYLLNHPASCPSSLSLSHFRTAKKQKPNPRNPTKRKNQNKGKRPIRQKKYAKQNKTKHKYIEFCSWGWGLSQSVVDIPSETLLERTDFPLGYRYQLVCDRFIVSWWVRLKTCSSHLVPLLSCVICLSIL